MKYLLRSRLRPKKLNPVDPVDTVNCYIRHIFEVKSEQLGIISTKNVSSTISKSPIAVTQFLPSLFEIGSTDRKSPAI